MTSVREKLERLQHPTGPLGPVRRGMGPLNQSLALGPLADLVGSWHGHGFNAIWRPFGGEDAPNVNLHFLMLNMTQDNIEFTAIPAPIPNRGFATQPDLNLYGVHYLQQTFDAYSGDALHVEPGVWVVVPPSDQPPEDSMVVRMASIPHGTAVLLQGPNPGAATEGPPNIQPLQPTPGVYGITPFVPQPGGGFLPREPPFTEQTLANDDPPLTNAVHCNGPYSPPITQALVDDPNSLLVDAINGQQIISTTELTISTAVGGGGAANIPFLGAPDAPPPQVNAFVDRVDATFWIETVLTEQLVGGAPPAKGKILPAPQQHPDSPGSPVNVIEPTWEYETTLQLQYSQVTWLRFNSSFESTILWPHVTVATLIKSGN